MEKDQNGSEALTAAAVTRALFAHSDSSQAVVTARTPHGSHHFVISAVEGTKTGPRLVLEPITRPSESALPEPPPGVAETAAEESKRTAHLSDAVLAAFGARGTATLEWSNPAPEAVAEQEAALRRLMVERIQDVQDYREVSIPTVFYRAVDDE